MIDHGAATPAEGKRRTAGMKLALPWLLLVALFTQIGGHAAIALAFARKREWRRTIGVILFPPLAPLWAWPTTLRPLAYAWIAALLVFAMGVAAS